MIWLLAALLPGFQDEEAVWQRLIALLAYSHQEAGEGRVETSAGRELEGGRGILVITEQYYDARGKASMTDTRRIDPAWMKAPRFQEDGPDRYYLILIWETGAGSRDAYGFDGDSKAMRLGPFTTAAREELADLLARIRAAHH